MRPSVAETVTGHITPPRSCELPKNHDYQMALHNEDKAQYAAQILTKPLLAPQRDGQARRETQKQQGREVMTLVSS